MNLIDALERVHSLAQLGLLNAESAEMDGPNEGQAEAVATFEDFIVNHWERLEAEHEAWAADKGPFATTDSIDLDALRRSAPNGPLSDGFVTALELALSQYDPETSILNQQAVALVAAFWRENGRGITENMKVIPIAHAAPV